MRCIKCKKMGKVVSTELGTERWRCECGFHWYFTPGIAFLHERIQFMSDCERELVHWATELRVPYGEPSDMMEGIIDAIKRLDKKS